jgi:hypothetical protein
MMTPPAAMPTMTTLTTMPTMPTKSTVAGMTAMLATTTATRTELCRSKSYPKSEVTLGNDEYNNYHLLLCALVPALIQTKPHNGIQMKMMLLETAALSQQLLLQKMDEKTSRSEHLTSALRSFCFTSSS